MNSPRGIAINKSGFVFIADDGNKYIVGLNPNTLKSRILSVTVEGGLEGPTLLYFCESRHSRDRLYISEYAGGRLIVVDGVKNLMFPD